ncbi:MAG: DUF1566 domain-containing protein [Nitrospinaceae bacterium]|mgnify:FL=1|jgi:hypothetical protein|nr:DUF1566 domain-containing protein [Nitrospinaceae bacterium]|tara:strand:+ start:216 stop:821 length:606 start_codon:yes stop_codon:yes gene_type:complete
MADEKEEFEETSDPELLDDEPETEWVGEEEWGDEEEENVALVEEEVPAFVDNGDGTISDTRANLMWKKDDSFKEYGYGINWFEAQDYSEILNEKKFAGYDDWRLPSGEEAKSAFSFTQSNTDKDGAETHISDLFEPGGGHNTWTYEEKPDYEQYAQKFSFITGNDMWEHKDNEYSHCRVTREVVQDDWEPEWRKETKTFER